MIELHTTPVFFFCSTLNLFLFTKLNWNVRIPTSSLPYTKDRRLLVFTQKHGFTLNFFVRAYRTCGRHWTKKAVNVFDHVCCTHNTIIQCCESLTLLCIYKKSDQKKKKTTPCFFPKSWMLDSPCVYIKVDIPL